MSGRFLPITYALEFVLLLGMAWSVSPASAAALSGTVLDASSGEPIVGASVTVERRRVGTQTDSLGLFVLVDVPDDAFLLVVTHVGYRKLRHLLRTDQAGQGPLHLVLHSRTISLPGIEVTSDPVGAADVHRSPSFVTVIERETFENKVTSVPQVLADATGLQVKRLGGLGSFSTLSIRGSSAEQVEVYLDGILLNSALGGGVNLENLPLSQVSRIEVYRGAAAAGNGMGGTVHIRTLSAESAFRLGGSTSWGSFDTKTASAMASGQAGKLGYVLVSDLTSSDSDFGFLDDNGTEYNVDDDVWAARQNSDFISSGLLLKGTVDASARARIYCQQNLFWKHQGIPGISNNQSKEARLNTFRSLSEAGLEIEALDGGLDVTQRAFYTHLGESFHDPRGEVGVGYQDNHYRNRSYGWDGRIHIQAGGGSGASLGLLARREGFQPSTTTGQALRLLESSRRTLGVRFGGDFKLPRELGILSASTNLEHQRSHILEENLRGYSTLAPDTTNTRRLFSLRGGVRIDVRPNFWLKANAGRSYRAPSFFELFGDRGSVFGNTDLVPERADTWDVGLRAVFQAAMVMEVGYFDHRYRDLIYFLHNSQAVSRPVNLGGARVWGFEATTDLPLKPWLGLSANYTFQRARDVSDIGYQKGKSLTNRPVHEAFIRLALSGGRWGGSYEYTFEDGNYRDRANLRRIPARQIHNATVRWGARDRITAALEAKNLFDNRIADQWGYPLPGRSYFITVKDTY